jgi:hypothetical protein
MQAAAQAKRDKTVQVKRVSAARTLPQAQEKNGEKEGHHPESENQPRHPVGVGQFQGSPDQRNVNEDNAGKEPSTPAQGTQSS